MKQTPKREKLEKFINDLQFQLTMSGYVPLPKKSVEKFINEAIAEIIALRDQELVEKIEGMKRIVNYDDMGVPESMSDVLAEDINAALTDVSEVVRNKQI